MVSNSSNFFNLIRLFFPEISSGHLVLGALNSIYLRKDVFFFIFGTSFVHYNIIILFFSIADIYKHVCVCLYYQCIMRL